MRPSALSIANYFLDIALRNGTKIKPLKLMKLVYIAHGYMLALLDKSFLNPRFDVVEAWKYGPVIPSVYHSFKVYKDGPITEKTIVLATEDNGAPTFVEPTLSDENAKKICEFVWDKYSKHSDNALVTLLHGANTPWGITYQKGANRVIPNTRKSMDVKLTSLDYARLVQFIALKIHSTLLNKTQVNKILFYIYGAYLADKGQLLFNDDTPKAWTYGPVFPIPNKRIQQHEIVQRNAFSDEQVDAFKNNKLAMSIAMKAVASMCNKSAVSLSNWSHQEGSPWYNTVYVKNEEGKITEQHPWNTPISAELIKQYFSQRQNRIFDNGGK